MYFLSFLGAFSSSAFFHHPSFLTFCFLTRVPFQKSTKNLLPLIYLYKNNNHWINNTCYWPYKTTCKYCSYPHKTLNNTNYVKFFFLLKILIKLSCALTHFLQTAPMTIWFCSSRTYFSSMVHQSMAKIITFFRWN